MSHGREWNHERAGRKPGETAKPRRRWTTRVGVQDEALPNASGTAYTSRVVLEHDGESQQQRQPQVPRIETGAERAAAPGLSLATSSSAAVMNSAMKTSA